MQMLYTMRNVEVALVAHIYIVLSLKRGYKYMDRRSLATKGRLHHQIPFANIVVARWISEQHRIPE